MITGLFEHRQQEVVSEDGVRIAVHLRGYPTAPPVVLLHGAWQWSACFASLVQQTAAMRFLILPDARGHGISEKPRERSAYRLARFAADLALVLQRLPGSQPVTLYAASPLALATLTSLLDHAQDDLIKRIGRIVVHQHAWSFVIPEPLLHRLASRFALPRYEGLQALATALMQEPAPTSEERATVAGWASLVPPEASAALAELHRAWRHQQPALLEQLKRMPIPLTLIHEGVAERPSLVTFITHLDVGARQPSNDAHPPHHTFPPSIQRSIIV